jgi:dephospho-CoA kinase
MSARLRIGLTGGIASGKSTVAQRFAELGVPVIDADESARRVVGPGSIGLARIISAFGPGILTARGELDRRALRTLIFAEAARRRELEALLHPLIRADMERQVDAASGPYVILMVPLLVEGGDRSRFDRILVVDVAESLQRDRLMQRDAASMEEADAILAAQASRAVRLKAADDVIENSGTVEALRAQVDRWHEHYETLARRLERDGTI